LQEGAKRMSENMFVIDGADFEHLRDLGFTEVEAEKLIYMKKHVGEEIEYQEMLQEQHRLAFIRWLVEHNRISK
jgi:hypothetical protein